MLVPIDFSEPSLEAVRLARGALRPGGELHVVYVLEDLGPREPGVAWGRVDDRSRIHHATEAMRGAVAKVGASDARLHVEIAAGNPGARIADVAKRIGVELVVVPSHGRTGFARIALGSVAERVVRLAPCPVLVLRSASLQREA